jgi:hypothetical protein
MNLAPELQIGKILRADHGAEAQKKAPKRVSTLRRLGSVVESVELPKILRFQGGFQDAEGILTTQMLVAAIILSIVVTIHTGTFSHDVLVAGDIRHAAFDAARGKELEEDSHERFVSGRLFVDGYISVSCSAYSLLSAAAIYVSLIFSGARGDPVLFQRWWRFGRVCILISYVTLLVSIIYFLRLNHDSVYLVYPKYNWNTVLNVSNATDSVRRLAAARGSSGAGPGDQAVGENSLENGVAGESRHYGYDVAEMSKNFKLGMNIALGLTSVMLAVGHAWINCCRGGANTDADGSSCSQAAESSAVEFLAEQSKLMKAQNELMRQFLRRQLPVTSGLPMDALDGDDGAKSCGIVASWAVGAPLDIEAQKSCSRSTSHSCSCV